MKRIFRWLGFLAALAAFVMLIIDGTTSIAGRVLVLTPLGEVVTRLAPQGAPLRWPQGLPEPLGRLAEAVLHGVPAVAAFAGLALIFGLIGRCKAPDMNLRRSE
jgi:hypothetical protein